VRSSGKQPTSDQPIGVQVGDGFLVEETPTATLIHPFGSDPKVLSADKKGCTGDTFFGPNAILLSCTETTGVFSLDGRFLYRWRSGPQAGPYGGGPITTAIDGIAYANGGTWCTAWDKLKAGLLGDCQPSKSQLDVFRTLDGQRLLSVKWNKGFFVAEHQVALSPSGNLVAFWHDGVLNVWKVPLSRH